MHCRWLRRGFLTIKLHGERGREPEASRQREATYAARLAHSCVCTHLFRGLARRMLREWSNHIPERWG
jgi:hypothetical protein